MSKLSIYAVIPAYNTEKTVGIIVKKTKKYVDKVIVVDDGSSDNTYREAKKAGADYVLRHITNRGTGAATKTGAIVALENDAEIVITLDSDFQHDPDDIPRFIKCLKEKNIDIVIGSRFLGDNKEMPLIKKIGNSGLNFLTGLLFGIKSTDTQSGFRAYDRKALEEINFELDSYAICTEILKEAKKHNLRVEEIPIDTIYPEELSGTTITAGFKIMIDMILRKVTR